MNNRILAVDLGYSNVKLAWIDPDGQIVRTARFINSISKVPDPLETDDDSLFRYLDSYYVIGSASLKVDRQYLMDVTDYEGLEEVYPVIMSYIFRKYGGMEQWDRVVIGLSLAFQDKREQMKKHLNDAFQTSNSDYFDVMLQGLAVKKAYSKYGLEGTRDETKRNDSKSLSYILLDGGFYSLDLVCVVSSDGGSNSAATSSCIGLKNTGVICCAKAVQDYLQSEKKIKTSLREALTIFDNKGIFSKRGRKVDISDEVVKIKRNYIEQVLNNLEDNFSDSMDMCSNLIVCGGLSYIMSEMMESDPKTVEIIEEHFPLSYIQLVKYDAEFYNAISYLELEEERMAGKED